MRESERTVHVGQHHLKRTAVGKGGGQRKWTFQMTPKQEMAEANEGWGGVGEARKESSKETTCVLC